MNHRTEKLNFFGNYNFNKTGNYFDLTLYRDQPDGNLRNYVNQYTHLYFNDLGHNAKAGVDYSIDKNTTVGVVFTGFWLHHPQDGPADFMAQRSLSQPAYLQVSTQKSILENSQNQLANLNFQHTFKNKSQFTTDFDYGHFQKEFTNTLNSTALILDQTAVPPIPKVINSLNTTIDIKTWKADYNTTISKTWKLETGVKWANIKTDNELVLMSGTVEKQTIDPSQSSLFSYEIVVL